MRGLAGTIFSAMLAGAVGVGLFFIKHEVKEQEARLAELNGEIQSNQEAIHVLKAEWSYLNDPERLRSLSQKYLGMKVVAPNQMVAMAMLPRAPGSTMVAQAPSRTGNTVTAMAAQPAAPTRPAPAAVAAAPPAPVRPVAVAQAAAPVPVQPKVAMASPSRAASPKSTDLAAKPAGQAKSPELAQALDQLRVAAQAHANTAKTAQTKVAQASVPQASVPSATTVTRSQSAYPAQTAYAAQARPLPPAGPVYTPPTRRELAQTQQQAAPTARQRTIVISSPALAQSSSAQSGEMR